MREEIRIEGLAPALSHYTDAVRFGDLLFVSGLVALDEKQRVVGKDDVVEQTRAILESLRKLLDAAGATLADVLKVTVFLIDVNDRTKINPVRQEFFGAHKPASTLIGVKALALPELLVEIEAVVGLQSDARIER
jgi:2-iminobutanoate/2-iminopropanoate deaminase